MAPETALRLISILCSLVLLPAVYLLARTLAPADIKRAAACTAVVVLALSAWEIEMARFGRMYAPFQAIFAWYLYHSSQLVRRQELWRWRWLIGLSILGYFVWEGWVVMAALNFLPILMGRRYWKLSHLALSGLVISLAYGLTRISFRFMSDVPPLPDNYLSISGNSGGPDHGWLSSNLLALSSGGWGARSVAFLIAAAAMSAVTALLIKSRPANRWTYLAVVSIGLALALNQVVLTAALLLGAWLLGWTDKDALGRRGWRGLLTVTGVATLAWVLLLWVQHSHTLFTLDAVRALAPLYAFPNYKQAIVQPWLYTMPIVSLLLAIGWLAGIIFISRAEEPVTHGLRWLLLAILLCSTVVAIAPTPYRETRYSFFLYPALIVLMIVSLSSLRTALAARARLPLAAIPVALIMAFLASEDFPARHLLAIDSFKANFRVGYPERIIRHYYRRTDHKAPGDFLREHAKPGDVIIITETALYGYLPWLDYVYLSINDERFTSQACQRGTVERWTNVPLIYDAAGLDDVFASQKSGSTWIVINKDHRIWHPWEQPNQACKGSIRASKSGRVPDLRCKKCHRR